MYIYILYYNFSTLVGYQTKKKLAYEARSSIRSFLRSQKMTMAPWLGLADVQPTASEPLMAAKNARKKHRTMKQFNDYSPL
jgi:hypothetical protein